MDIEVDRDRIITKFRRNGHLLNKNCLQMVTQHLKHTSHANKRLDEIIKKVDQMVIMNQQKFNQHSLKLILELLSHNLHNGKGFDSIESLMKHLRKWTTFYLNPYENQNRFFIDRPHADMFNFNSEDYLQMNLNKFKSIRQHNFSQLENSSSNSFIGVLYENYSMGKRVRIMLQNQVNQIQLIFSPGFQTDCFLIPGCTYIAKGEFKSKDLQLTVTQICLPKPLPSKKQNLLNMKLKAASDNLLHCKDNLNFTPEDFKTYQIRYNKEENKGKPTLIFGNFKINNVQVNRVKKIIEQFISITNGVQSIILMMADKGHDEDVIDLKKQMGDNFPIYLVPHINNEGPRILPKIPVLKNDYNVRVTSNPAKFSIQGRQCVFMNYPIIQNLFTKSVISKKQQKIDEEDMVKRVSKMLHSQNNVGLCNNVFWKQNNYLNISGQSLLFVYDNACHQIKYVSEGQGLISVGNFDREGDFVYFAPHLPDPIQFSKDTQK